MGADIKAFIAHRQAEATQTGKSGYIRRTTAAAAPTFNTGVAPTTFNNQTATSLIVTMNGKMLTGNTLSTFNNINGNVRAYSGSQNILSTIHTSISQEIGAIQSSSSSTGEGRLYFVSPRVPSFPITDPLALNNVRYSETMVGQRSEQLVSTSGVIDRTKYVTIVATNNTSSVNASGVSNFGAYALASAINNNSRSQFWAMIQSFDSNGQNADMVYIFTKNGGNFNDLLACDVADDDAYSRSALNTVSFENTESGIFNQSGTTFSLGGEYWGTMKPIQTKSNLGNEVWNLTLNGRDVGAERDLWIANDGEIRTPSLTAGIINGMDRNSFVEIQNAANSPWAGGEVRTQSAAQAALDAITESINTKDKIRADLGALQNRLENTMTNLTVQAENLQASESRISDVDVATEMTEFTRNNVLAQAATSMLAQANSLSQLALSLIG
jgi:flagellin-like hook-associated protein FlgL